MSLKDKLADMYHDPAIAIWAIFGAGCSSLLILITYPEPICIFYVFLTLMTGIWLGVSPTIFTDTVEEMVDWKEEVEVDKVAGWTIVGLILLFAATFIMSFLLGADISKAAIWVPSNMVPSGYYLMQMEAKPITGVNAFVLDLFATWFAVIPGEESLKSNFIVLYKVYERFSWSEEIPFAAQPAYVAGNGLWAVEHVIAGQNPPPFAANVFLCGTLMGEASAQSGTMLVSWLLHGIFNTLILVSILIGGGYLRLIVA